MHAPSGSPLLAAMSGRCKCSNPGDSALRITHPGTLVTGKFTNISRFHFSPTVSGVVVSVLATGPKVAGSNPVEDDGF
jgi:hypothetical protein